VSVDVINAEISYIYFLSTGHAPRGAAWYVCCKLRRFFFIAGLIKPGGGSCRVVMRGCFLSGFDSKSLNVLRQFLYAVRVVPGDFNRWAHVSPPKMDFSNQKWKFPTSTKCRSF
jgi:hypothetical protein